MRKSKENRINKVWLIEGPFSFKAKRKESTIEKSDSIYLGLKQRYGSPGIAVERDVLAENRVSVSKYRVKSL
jgi:hypothetical protein